jgi:hypothetical protein
MLVLLDLCEVIESGYVFNPNRIRRRVLGIDIREHNRAAIRFHKMALIFKC